MDSRIIINQTTQLLTMQNDQKQANQHQQQQIVNIHLDQIIDNLDLQNFNQLLDQLKVRIQYFEDCKQPTIYEWIQIYEKQQNYIQVFNKVKQNIQGQIENNENDIQIVSELKQTYDQQLKELKQLVDIIKIIETDKILLVGQFKPWMSGYGMMQIPLKTGGQYKIIGEISFCKLVGEGIYITSKNYKYYGNFAQNILSGRATVKNELGDFEANFYQNKLIDGDFQLILNDQRRLNGTIVYDNNKKLTYTNITYYKKDNLKLVGSDLNLEKALKQFQLYNEEELIVTFDKTKLYDGFGSSERDDLVYFGQFQNNTLNGYGLVKLKVNNFIVKEGVFENNVLIKGKIYYAEINMNNSIKQQGTFLNEQLNGEGIKFYQNQQIMEKGDFENGFLIKGIKYYENQQKKEEGIFREDYLINGTKYYESNGKIKERGQFQNGQLIGEGERRHENGFCESYGIFKDGLLDSEEFQSAIHSNQGNPLQIGYFCKGKLNSKNDELDDKNQKIDRRGKKYYQSGRIFEEGYFKDGELHGEGCRYYDIEKTDGKSGLAEKGTFLNGKLHSDQDCIQYYLDGKKKWVAKFQYGLSQGKGKVYFDHYILEGNFRQGQVCGSASLQNYKLNLYFKPTKDIYSIDKNGQKIKTQDLIGYQNTYDFLKEAYESKVYESKQFVIEAETQISEEIENQKNLTKVDIPRPV